MQTIQALIHHIQHQTHAFCGNWSLSATLVDSSGCTCSSGSMCTSSWTSTTSGSGGWSHRSCSSSKSEAQSLMMPDTSMATCLLHTCQPRGLAGWLAGWLAGGLAGWLAGKPAGWQAGWLAG
eukprot:10124810-Heterocapsa_arctica.AAC.1